MLPIAIEEKRPSDSCADLTENNGTVRRASLHAHFENGRSFSKTRSSESGDTCRKGAAGELRVKIGGFANVA